jgi:hypothetical protein
MLNNYYFSLSHQFDLNKVPLIYFTIDVSMPQLCKFWLQCLESLNLKWFQIEQELFHKHFNQYMIKDLYT